MEFIRTNLNGNQGLLLERLALTDRICLRRADRTTLSHIFNPQDFGAHSNWRKLPIFSSYNNLRPVSAQGFPPSTCWPSGSSWRSASRLRSSSAGPETRSFSSCRGSWRRRRERDSCFGAGSGWTWSGRRTSCPWQTCRWRQKTLGVV